MPRCIGALAKVQRFIDRAVVAEISDIGKRDQMFAWATL
jgi:hypothetical protein